MLFPLVFLLALWSASASAASAEDIAIKTLPPTSYDHQYRSQPVLESADALMSDWEGDHWASLDADQDKVALSWSTTDDEAIFQVRHFWCIFDTSRKMTGSHPFVM